QTNNDIKKKKYEAITAQNHLHNAKTFYEWKKQTAANQDEEVKKAQDALSNWGATSTNDPKYKAAVADFDKKISDAGAKWAATDEGKQGMKKVNEVEHELVRAREECKRCE